MASHAPRHGTSLEHHGLDLEVWQKDALEGKSLGAACLRSLRLLSGDGDSDSDIFSVLIRKALDDTPSWHLGVVHDTGGKAVANTAA